MASVNTAICAGDCRRANVHAESAAWGPKSANPYVTRYAVGLSNHDALPGGTAGILYGTSQYSGSELLGQLKIFVFLTYGIMMSDQLKKHPTGAVGQGADSGVYHIVSS